MASYHLAVKTVSRATGRSAPAAAAYRTATRIENERDGLVHDYTRRGGVEGKFLVVPAGAAWAEDRSALWNAVEVAEKRKDAKVAREYELALPHALSPGQRRELAHAFAQEVVDRFEVAADVAIHAPHPEGDQRNWHVHILTTTRAVSAEGLGAKTRALDVAQTSGPLVEDLRQTWERQVNLALLRARVADRVEHRSFARQGLGQVAEQHMGPAAMAMERRAERERVAEAVRSPQARPGVSEPVTRIGRHNAEVRERNRVLALAQKALDAAREHVGELERAVARGARQVLGLLRGVGASIGAEQRRQEAERQAQEVEKVRQVEARRVELERQAAERQVTREQAAAQHWAPVQAAGELARKQEAEKAQQQPEVKRERLIVGQKPRGSSMER